MGEHVIDGEACAGAQGGCGGRESDQLLFGVHDTYINCVVHGVVKRKQ